MLISPEKKQTPKNKETNMTEETNMTANEALGNMDFNVEDDYKPEPIIPNGTYHGGITNITFNTGGYNITWKICLHRS